MAETRLTDVIVPEVFAPYVQLLSTELSAFVQSGVAASSPLFDNLLSGGGQTFNIPHWNDLPTTEANVSSDNPATVAVPDKLDTLQTISVRHNRNQSWSSMDLVSALAGDDPMEAIARLVAGYWVQQEQTYVIQSLLGVLGDNQAAPAGTDTHVIDDMVNEIGDDAVPPILAAELISADAVLNAAATMGDHASQLTAIAMHSVPFTRLQSQNLISFIPNARGEINIPTYLGRRVIVDDGLPAVAGTNRIMYTSILFGAGSIARAVGPARVPVEVDRSALNGNGGGQETLTSRQQYILHPQGWRWTSSSMAGSSPTNAELANIANWSRQFDRKLTRIAFLRTNG